MAEPLSRIGDIFRRGRPGGEAAPRPVAHPIDSAYVSDVGSLDVIDEYLVGSGEARARIRITSDGRYLVSEPNITKEIASLYDEVIRKIDIGMPLDDVGDPEGSVDELEKAFWDVVATLRKAEDSMRHKKTIRYYLSRDIVGYGILDPMMLDPDIEDILCTSPGRPVRVVHKRHGRFHALDANVAFESDTDTERFIQRVYSRTGTEPTEARPMSVTHMADGSRISCTFGRAVSKAGPTIAIRKFPASPFTITHMMRGGTLTTEMAAWMWTLIDAKAAGLIIGVTGGGKTSLMGALISMMNPQWRILTIEDTLELQIPHQDWVRFNTRRSYGMLADKFDITIKDMIDLSLTQRPDFEIVGEIRLSDMGALFQSLGTGHGGMTSFHASTPDGAMTRMRSDGVSEGELALLWFSAHAVRVRGPGGVERKVGDISDIVMDGTGKVRTKTIYSYDRLKGRFLRHVSRHKDSARYAEACDICGIDDPDADMARRIGLLQRCVDEKAHDVMSVFRILGEYYREHG